MRINEKTKEQLINELAKLRQRNTKLEKMSIKHKQAEEEFQRILKEYRYLKSIINRSPAMAFLWPVQEGWPVEFVTNNVKEVLGYLADDFMSGKVSWPSITHNKDVPRLEAEVAQYLEEGITEFSQEYRLITKLGDVRWMRDRNKVLYDSTGSATHIQSIVLDITERKQAEKAILEERDFNQLIIANADEGICVCYEIEEFPYVRFTIWNDFMTTITGYTMEEINCSGWYQSMYPDPVVQEQAIERMKGMRIGNNIQGEEWEITRANGEKRQLLIKTRIISGSEGVPHVLAVMNDITEHKKADEALQRAHDRLEMRVKERTDELESAVKLLQNEIIERNKTELKLMDAEKRLRSHANELMESNAALKVLLKQRAEDQKELELNILSNVKHLVLPYLTKLKRNRSFSEELTYLNILESNLKEIIAPFSQQLSSKYLFFTQKEIQIADLIKDGKQDKDIMEILAISLDTVKTHRRNIRKKLGINKTKINLRTKLLSIKQ